jgi:hypothetical protein
VTRRFPIRGSSRRTCLLAVLPAFAGTLFASGGAGASANTDVETQVKAAFIYNFARFVEWPARSSPGAIRIGILGRGDLALSLEEVTRGKSVNGRLLEVAHLNSIAEADRCEILLIERSETKHLKDIVLAVAGKPILTVCDGGNCWRDGVMIAFRIVEESVRFQINQEAAERAGLKVSSQLLKVAIPAEGRH